MDKMTNYVAKGGGGQAELTSMECLLLSHVDMCYSVALALTRNPDQGKELARATITWAWRNQDELMSLGEGGVKMFLLQDLRRRFRKACAMAGSARVHRSRQCAFTVIPSGQDGDLPSENLCMAETAGVR